MDEIVIRSNLVKIDLEAKNYKEAIKKMSDLLIDNGMAKETYYDALIRREENFPTGLEGAGIGFAIPHADIEHVRRTSMAVGILKDSVEFSSMEDYDKEIDVKIIIMLAVREPSKQVALLQSLMEMMQDKEVINELLEVNNNDNLVNSLQKKLKI